MLIVSNQPTAASGTYDGTIQENGSLFPGLFTNEAASTIIGGCGTGVSVTVTFPNKLYLGNGLPDPAGNGTVWINAAGTTGATGPD